MPQQSLHSHIGAAHNHIRKHKWTQCDYATTRKYQLVLHIKAEHENIRIYRYVHQVV
jgi:hypothetical protein